jgi:hypothetical protein
MEQLRTLSYIAVISWVSKMCFAIIIPAQHPMYRSIFGYDGIIYFAGDEYMFIPVYLTVIIYSYGKSFNYKQIRNIICLAFFLGLVAQRKGVVTVFIPFLFLVYGYWRENKIIISFSKIYYVLSSLILFIFLFIENKIIHNKLFNLAFYEYHTLSIVSVDSILNLIKTNFSMFLFGITPFGKYEIINLPSFADHFMAFGNETGEKYRYALWSFPYGRLILNTGIIGSIIYLYYLIKSARYSSPIFFIIISSIGFCIIDNITPVNALSLGISLAVLYTSQRSQCQSL